MKPTNLAELMSHMKNGTLWTGAATKHGSLDWSALPTFGGSTPHDTSEIWSWDTTHAIIGRDSTSLEIVER